MARSSRDLHNILYKLQEQSCGFVSLVETWCDTTGIGGGIAEFERGLIRSRCDDGIERG